MTEITWNELTADEREALIAIKWGEVSNDLSQPARLFNMGLIEVNKLNSMLRPTDAGREVLAQKPPATEKTVKLKTRSADGLYWEVLYTDGTWAGEEVSHE
jgi:hypothetical protein